MEQEKPSIGMTLVALVAFLMMATTGAVLLLVALVMWVATLVGSLMWSTLIVGGGALLMTVLIYFAALHRPLKIIRERVDTVYDVAQSLREAYRWIVDRLHWIVILWGLVTANEKSGTK